MTKSKIYDEEYISKAVDKILYKADRDMKIKAEIAARTFFDNNPNLTIDDIFLAWDIDEFGKLNCEILNIDSSQYYREIRAERIANKFVDKYLECADDLKGRIINNIKYDRSITSPTQITVNVTLAEMDENNPYCTVYNHVKTITDIKTGWMK